MKTWTGWMGRVGALGGCLLFVSLSIAGCKTEENLPPPIWTQEDALPPLSGGTLLVTKGQIRAVASDPDTNVIWTARLDTGVREHVIELKKGDEPGRLVESSDGKVHVALRGSGEIATIDPTLGKLIRRTPVCQMPRGVDYSAESDKVIVGCAEGKIVTFAAKTGIISTSLTVENDVRDVFYHNGHFIMTRLRSAELITVDAYGQEIDRAKPVEVQLPFKNALDQTTEATFFPTVAWRTAKMPDGSFLMVHQRASTAPVEVKESNGYASNNDSCAGIVHAAIARFNVDEFGQIQDPAATWARLGGALPVDIMADTDEDSMTVVAAGSRHLLTVSGPVLSQKYASCVAGVPVESGMPVGVSESNGQLVVLLRSPIAIEVPERSVRIQLDRTAVNRGHALFHLAPNGMVACASCHPEGREDGHVWNFATIGPRRSQSLRGGIQRTLPLHWDGDMANMHEIVSEVLVNRMGGSMPSAEEELALANWIEALPKLAPLRDPEDESALRGKDIFERDDVGCLACHSGEYLTNNRNENVGLENILQVPSLRGVAWRTPLMHHGCAKTLAERFDPDCGGAKHGHTDQLSAKELADLIAYLESL
ncbi:MAG: c-type cytochrome [Polyangiaceae bacterium]|nr:c-type cytochrome [Polyangiaceae bacterium]